MASPDITALTASCHCGTLKQTFNIPASSLPLRSSLCHCSRCRHTSGQLFSTFITIPDAPDGSSNIPEASKFTAYPFGETITWYFCPTCGAHIYASFAEGGWSLCSGMLEEIPSGLTERSLEYVGKESTGDGGAVPWFGNEIGGKNLKRYVEADGDSAELDDQAIEEIYSIPPPAAAIEPADKLEARCGCQKVKFYISPPNDDVEVDEENGAWWLIGDKYRGRLDGCDSCRLVSGFEYATWTFVPQANIFHLDATPLDPLTHPAMRHYQSSPGIWRDFCGTCGAVIFYRSDERGPSQVVDIGAGLLQSKRGARAEDWITWVRTNKVDPDAKDRAMADALWKGSSRRTQMMSQS